MFIDSFKGNRKGILLHNGNFDGPVTIVQSVHFKETYENVTIKFSNGIYVYKNNTNLCKILKLNCAKT